MIRSTSQEYPSIVPYDPETRAPWTELMASREEYAERLSKVRLNMSKQKLDGLLVVGSEQDPASISYLTNFNRGSGTTMLLIPLEGEPVVVADGILHGEPMHSMFWDFIFEDVRPASRDPQVVPGAVTNLVADGVRDRGLNQARIGVASPSVLSAAHAEHLQELLPEVDWRDGTAAVADTRMIKSEAEIACMRRACEITAVAMQAALDTVVPGNTERDVAIAAQTAMMAAGAEGFAFETAVSSGPRAGLKHATPTNRITVEGDLVFLDMGATWRGYHADLSRCCGVGNIDSDRQAMLDASREIFEHTLKAVKPGNTVRDIYRAAERRARRTGFIADYMPHGLGHGVGLALFERPFLSPEEDTVLEAGMIFALEPMLVRYNTGTAVVEETVLVTETGAECLSGMDW